MLRNITELRGYAIRATDGSIGKVDDVYFDDKTWTVRYLVADTGSWLVDRKVLITPISLGHPDWLNRLLPVSLTKAQVEHSPSIETHKPVSRQHEAEYMAYYGYPFYWGGDSLWGMGSYPGHLTMADAIAADIKTEWNKAAAEQFEDCHLRATSEVIGQHVQATDGEIGHVSDMLVDERTWAVRYLVLDTSDWWVGHKVLVSPKWITDVNWADSKVHVGVSRQVVQAGPVYDATEALDRQREEAIFTHYGRPAYWDTEVERDLVVTK